MALAWIMFRNMQAVAEAESEPNFDMLAYWENRDRIDLEHTILLDPEQIGPIMWQQSGQYLSAHLHRPACRLLRDVLVGGDVAVTGIIIGSDIREQIPLEQLQSFPPTWDKIAERESFGKYTDLLFLEAAILAVWPMQNGETRLGEVQAVDNGAQEGEPRTISNKRKTKGAPMNALSLLALNAVFPAGVPSKEVLPDAGLLKKVNAQPLITKSDPKPSSTTILRAAGRRP